MYKAICENPENKLGEKGYIKKKETVLKRHFQSGHL